jgi:hypothetical protein
MNLPLCVIDTCRRVGHYTTPSGCKPQYCTLHKPVDSTLVEMPYCRFPRCLQPPKYGINVNAVATYCERHRSYQYVEVCDQYEARIARVRTIQTICEVESCIRKITHCYSTHRTIGFCDQHMLPGSKPCTTISCVAAGCTDLTIYDNHRCAVHYDMPHLIYMDI